MLKKMMVYILENMKITIKLALVLMLLRRLFLKEYMRKILKLKDVKEILMVFIKDILLMVRDKDMELSNGITDKNFREIGRMV